MPIAICVFYILSLFVITATVVVIISFMLRCYCFYYIVKTNLKHKCQVVIGTCDN